MSEQLYHQHILPIRAQLLQMATRMLEDEEDGEDAVQEVLLKLWRNVQSLGNYQNVEAFATTVLKNHCYDKIKVRRRNEKLDTLDDNDLQTETPYLLIERKNNDELIKMIVERLPSLQRIILQMKDIDDYDIDEIAQITGAKVEAIRMNLSRARKKVKTEFLRISNK